MSLPRRLLEILDPPLRAIRRSPEEGWMSLPVVSRKPTGTAIVDLHEDFELPPWWAGPYREDVPKR